MTRKGARLHHVCRLIGSRLRRSPSTRNRQEAQDNLSSVASYVGALERLFMVKRKDCEARP